MKLYGVPMLALCLLFTLCYQSSRAQQPIKPLLLKDVRHLPLPDTPNMIFSLLAFSDTAEYIGIASLAEDAPVKMGVIVSAPLGKGRIIALGTAAYLHQTMLQDTGVHQLAQNMLTWARKGGKRAKMGIYSMADDAFLALAHQQHISTYALKHAAIEKHTAIIYLETDVTGKDSLQALETFVRNGGTLIQVSPYERMYKTMLAAHHSDMGSAGINTLLAKAGIYDLGNAFYSSANNKVLVTDSVPGYLQVSTMIPLLKRKSTGYVDDLVDEYVVPAMLDLLFEYNDVHSPVLQSLKTQYKVPDTLAIPTRKHPVVLRSEEDKTRYHLAQLFDRKLHDTGDNKYAVHPGASDFPGAVPDSAQRIDTSISIPVQVGTQGLLEPNPVYFRPHSTGLYVPPGTVVKVVLQTSDTAQHLVAQVGVHADNLSSLNRLTRSAENMVRTFPMNNDTTEVYSPFGGLLQLKIADTSTRKAIRITVLGAVKAPYFKLGQTTEADWNASIRNNPAPWAELATDKIILTVPAYRIRQLNNPVKLMQFYDEVMDADADLAKISRNRTHPERVIVDQDVAWGYMYTVPEHIIVPDDESCGWMVDETFMRDKGSWGLFHELGHRHQFWGIDFNELGEVTVNLFSMRVYDKVLHKGIYNHPAIGSKEVVQKTISKYLHNDPSFEKWGKDAFLELCMYIELIDHFGWQCIDDTYTKYRAMPEAQYPQSQEDKRDLWFLTICGTTKTNLTRFFDTWKVPVSDKAKAQVTAYPTWLPDELKETETVKTPVLGR